MDKISAVIFDMDGLMFDTERLSLEAWRAVAKKEGFEMKDDILIATVGRNARDTGIMMKQCYGETFPYEELREQSEAYMRDFIISNGMPIKKGLLELLEFLKSRGIKTAVATSTVKEFAEENIKSCSLLDRFDHITCGDEVEKGKPEPDIFLLAAKKLGCKPEECIVLEDSENGIRGAHKAGMKPIMIPDVIIPTQEIKQLTHQIFDSLDQVISYLKV